MESNQKRKLTKKNRGLRIKKPQHSMDLWHFDLTQRHPPLKMEMEMEMEIRVRVLERD